MVGRKLVTLRDTMTNCYTGVWQAAGRDGHRYAAGIVTGMVGAIMALESKDFSNAIQFLKGCLLEDLGPNFGTFDVTTLPESWRAEWARWSYAKQ